MPIERPPSSSAVWRGKARIAFPFVTYMAVRLLGALPPALAGRLKARRSETA